MVCHQLAEFGDHRYCIVKILFLVYNMIKQDYTIGAPQRKPPPYQFS